MRLCIKDYLNNKLDFVEFYDFLKSELGSEFDPFEESINDLSVELKNEINFYSQYTGGEFGETEYIIPKNSDYKYGENNVKYDWIDKAKFKNEFKEKFEELNLIKLQ